MSQYKYSTDDPGMGPSGGVSANRRKEKHGYRDGRLLDEGRGIIVLQRAMMDKTKTSKGKQDKAETRQRAADTTAQSRHAVMARGWMMAGGHSPRV